MVAPPAGSAAVTRPFYPPCRSPRHDRSRTGRGSIYSRAAGGTGHLRETDLPACLGGDEFALLLEDADLSAATRAVEKIRAAMANLAARWPSASPWTTSAAASPPSPTSRIWRWTG
ncbi:MAG: diguanylate cyclase domain-containing protein [Thiohalospira sp.]